ncbi:hypothetical protein BKA67DRAFT_638321 [Truncatella angustata]|uniref:Uncharacterized protein n=1 Tax=Truncatella angustata TaxID=152316 RepID=A0A9P8UFC8_9PEZI|nr:uncharacterized protein BKA67DRAFT_638321 [Truncatella angustata]KAH6648960.1 hypothetical protein BKA67DRAFT_638321 [Truncatella angustata]
MGFSRLIRVRKGDALLGSHPLRHKGRLPMLRFCRLFGSLYGIAFTMWYSSGTGMSLA